MCIQKYCFYLLLFVGVLPIGQAIVGGEKVKGDVYNSVVGFNACTGVFVHPRLILTAAHCVNDLNFSSNGKKVFLALKNRSRFGRNKSHRVEKIGIHPDYYAASEKPDQFYSYKTKDFAFVLLEKPVDSITPAEIEYDSFDTTQENTFTAVGFGGSSRIGASKSKSNSKKLVNLKFLDFKLDRLRMFGKEIIKKTLFFKTKYREGICAGDSGGGLFSVNDYDRLVAITVAAPKNCKKQNYSIYEPINRNICWVQEQSGVFLGKVDCDVVATN